MVSLIVTAAAALTAGKVDLATYYEPAHFVQLGGFRLRNFHGELCGGGVVYAAIHDHDRCRALDQLLELSIRHPR